jgi:peptidoglycan/xylan/chitin deacetylase (PgdA/CDA1 family)
VKANERLKSAVGSVLGILVCLIALPASTRAATLEVERGLRGRHQIALTFDACGEADCFQELLGDLEHAHVRSTFFVTGDWAERNPECAREIIQHGHEVGNHTWHHLDLTKHSDEIVRQEILQGENILARVCQRDPSPLWRAPFGARDNRVLEIAHALGYRSIYWTIDSLDSVDPPKTPQFLVDRIVRKSDTDLDGAIILLHVGEPSTAAALPEIISNLQRRRFHLVTVSILLDLPR